MNKDVLRLAAVLTIAMATSACSTMSDVGDGVGSTVSEVGDSFGGAVSELGTVLDPSNWFSDNEPVMVDADPSDSALVTPDLAALPPRPAPSATPADQASVAGSLAADRNQSIYSAEALRGGTEAAAAPPPPASPRTTAPSAVQSAAPGVLPEIVAAAPQQAAPVRPQPQISAPASGAQPAVPAVPAGASGMRPVAINTATPSDAALGFKPSTAPALNPSISQWVAPPIVARYQQTAALAGLKTSPVVSPVASAGGSLRAPRSEGGPDSMSGAVVANLDAVQSTSVPSVYANMGAQAPTAVVNFPGDGTLLSAEGRAQVRAAAQAFQSRGGQGFIRVVGHASSRTANMPVQQHLTVIFEKSQSRANAVAQELIRQGVPASRVLIEAVGDSQPIYYESMPEGENGNRRAEIFLQG